MKEDEIRKKYEFLRKEDLPEVPSKVFHMISAPAMINEPVEVIKNNLYISMIHEYFDKFTELKKSVDFFKKESNITMELLEQNLDTTTREKLEEQKKIFYEHAKNYINTYKEMKKRIILSSILYNSEMRFIPVIKTEANDAIYHIYERENKNPVVSMIGPAEWNHPYKEFIASVFMRPDKSFDLIGESKYLDLLVEKTAPLLGINSKLLN